jgi:UDP-glucuronate decarboxylase
MGMQYLDEFARLAASDSKSLIESFSGKKVLVTGSTGLVGSTIVRTLLAANKYFDAHLSVILPVRNIGKAQSLFGGDATCLEWSLGDSLDECPAADYVVHAAALTASKDLRYKPVEVIGGTVSGTTAVLNYCRRVGVAGSVYISSMEVYGEVDGVATEDNLGLVDPTVVRSSYPESKRLSEALVAAYADEYSVNACSARLAQTFGAGASHNDSRVFADFARRAIAGEDIVLLTDGSKSNPYLSTRDLPSAVLTLLTYGDKGQSYNVANEATYCSIREMAELVANKFSNGKSSVEFDIDQKKASMYPKPTHLILDTAKIRNLGWQPHDNLENMYASMIRSWNDQ